MSNANLYLIITNAGLAADQAARVPGAAPLVFQSIDIGDGGGTTPAFTAASTALINQLATFPVNGVAVDASDPTVLDIGGAVPTNVNGFVVREVGVRTSTGVLYAIAAAPDTYLPTPAQGAAVNLQVVLKIKESNGVGNVTLTTAPGTWATQAWVIQQIATLAPPASEPHTFISDFTQAVTALIPPQTLSPQMTGAVTTTGAGQGATTLSAGVVAAANMAAGAAVGNLGYTPVNRAGDTMTGALNVPQLQLGPYQPVLFYDDAAAVDSKYFQQYVSNGQLVFQTANDANNAADVYLRVTRTGFIAALNWYSPSYFYVQASFFGSTQFQTMPAGDATQNAATTAFVTNALANAVPPGCKTFVLADSEGSCVGGSLVITSTTATITFSTPQPDTNYNVWGTCFGVGPQKNNSGATVGPIYATDIVRNATLTKSTVECIFTFPQQVATDPTTGISTAATLSTFSLSIAR